VFFISTNKLQQNQLGEVSTCLFTKNFPIIRSGLSDLEWLEVLVIVLLKRADLKVNGLPADQVRLHHTTLHQSVIDTADLI